MNEASLREHLLYLLGGGGAHINVETAVDGVEPAVRGQKVPGLAHTLWHQLEHLRLCQWDILEFSRNSKHVSPDFPEGYWPKEDAPPSNESWNKSVEQFQNDLKEMMALVADPQTNLFEPIPHGNGQTILREALLVADHNAYHLGQFVLTRRLLGDWKN